ncbi:MAG: DNA translocase FtsK 4TM domain-containing protein [Candidatus Gracilibacteria bacterium]|nr:DNA translocase FtsK 4TM domain-containing protein [Candidatus Gracilibacteria bacterium]
MARRRRTTTTTRRRRATTARKRTYRRRRTKKQPMTLNLAEHVSREISGIFFIAFAVLNFLSLQSDAGVFGAMWTQSVIMPLFGLGAYVAPAASLVLGLVLLVSKKVEFALGRVLGLGLLLMSVLGLIQLSAPIETLFNSAPEYGGYLGFTSSFILISLFGEVGAKVILVGLTLASMLMIFNISFNELFGFLKEMVFEDAEDEEKEIIKVDKKTEQAPLDLKTGRIKKGQEFELNIVRGHADKVFTKDEKKRKGKNTERIVPISGADEKKENDKPEEIPKVDYSNYQFPELTFLKLDPKNEGHEDDHLVKNAEMIRRKLNQFNIKVTMKDAHVGPTVIQYTLKPAEDVKLSKITALKNDLALALSAKAIRIEAPIPGKGLVGIEIPAKERAIVSLGGIIRTGAYQNNKGDLKICLGRDVSGQAVNADLTKMPHMLVAGQTGSGKSIGVNSFLISLLYQHSPETLRLILIDPKRVELTSYNGIPHLLTPVITEPDKALQSLKWSVSEMNRRYKEFARHGKRNIDEYNETFKDNRMPFIVIVIDELADLMMAASKEIEATICRIAQMARATGMHLIIATQRPSVDVITGLIKANVPTRLAYTVATGTDSRTIIDSIGAEDLLGRGDMLYLTSDMGKPLRIQGAYINTKEIEKVIQYIKINSPTGVQYDDSVVADQSNVVIPGMKQTGRKSSTNGGASDLERAIQAIREGKKASASYLQRRCSFGYAKAARILDELEEMGLVGPSNGAKPRAIFISEEEPSEVAEQPAEQLA